MRFAALRSAVCKMEACTFCCSQSCSCSDYNADATSDSKVEGALPSAIERGGALNEPRRKTERRGGTSPSTNIANIMTPS